MRHPVVDCPHGVVLRSADDRVDGRSFGTAINYHLKPPLVRSTLDSCRGDATKGHGSLGPILLKKGF
jgi:hypothetical protein